MFQACRPAGRRFYWVLAVLMASSGVRLAAREVSAREPEKPASYPEAKPRVAELAPRAALPTPQSGPTLTNECDRHRLHSGWNACPRCPDHHLAGVCDGERSICGSGRSECHTGGERRLGCGAGSERGQQTGN